MGTGVPQDEGGEARNLDKPPILTSRELFQGRREVIIEHGADQYRLLITSNNKLILMK